MNFDLESELNAILAQLEISELADPPALAEEDIIGRNNLLIHHWYRGRLNEINAAEIKLAERAKAAGMSADDFYGKVCQYTECATNPFVFLREETTTAYFRLPTSDNEQG